MKVAFPLSLKVSVWLLLNLLLLGGLGAAVLILGGGLGWDALVRGAPGERLQSAANLLASKLGDATSAQVAAALKRLPAARTVRFALVESGSGEIRSGAPLAFSPSLLEQLHLGRSALQPPPPPPPSLDAPTPPPQRDDTVTADELERGRHLVRTHDPAGWWVVVRLPPLERDGQPDPLTLVGFTPSFATVLGALDLTPWLLAGGSAMMVSILFWLPFVHRITRSLAHLGAATEKIAGGDFATRVPATRRDELGQLGESVNQMAARLDTLVNGQKKFLGDVAHELGSPIARLQVALEILESRAAHELQPQVADVREEVQQIAALVNELLAFTRAGLQPREVELARFPLGPLFADVLAREAATAQVHHDPTLAVAVRADAALLTRALANLVRNALRHAGPHADIRLTASVEGETICILLEDDGPGVPAEALARLGEPFYRPEAARTRETGGVGLGLSIVRASIAACGGEVRFANRAPHGFRAEIRLAGV